MDGNVSRRDLLEHAAVVMAATPVAIAIVPMDLHAAPEDMRVAVARVTGGVKPSPGRVKLEIPPLSENGNTVPINVTVESPMIPTDYVKAIHVFNEKKPPAQHHQRVVRSPCRPGLASDACQTVGHADHRRDRCPVRREFLDGQRRGHRHARCLSRGAHLMSRTIIRVNPSARAGEIITVKTLIQHKMESGFRFTNTGQQVTRDIITTFVATWDGEEIWRADLSPAIAANPFIAFTTVATKTGTLRVTWSGDNGFSVSDETRITVV